MAIGSVDDDGAGVEVDSVFYIVGEEGGGKGGGGGDVSVYSIGVDEGNVEGERGGITDSSITD